MHSNLQPLNYPYQYLHQPQLPTFLPAAAPMAMQHMPVIPGVALYSPSHPYNQPPTSAMAAAAHLREVVRAQ
eukprot:537308-Pleurochrysis_carterae.AAC.1